MVSDREDRWQSTESKWERVFSNMTPGKVVVGIVLFIALLGVSGFAIRWITADPKGSLEAREQTVGDGDYRIAAYDHFYDLCASVQIKEGQIAALESELAETNPSPQRIEQINASLTALRGSRAGSISQYNVDANKDYTQGQFRDSDLPYELDPNQEATSCTA